MKSDECENPLVMRWGSFGDLIMMSPVLQAISERAGQPVDMIASGPWSYTMFDGSPWVGKVWTIDSPSTPNWLEPGKRKTLKDLRQRRKGPFWVFDTHKQARKFCVASGWPSDDIAYPDVASLPEQVVHAADMFWHFATTIPAAFDLEPIVKPDRWQWQIPPPDDAIEDCEHWLQSIGVGDAPTICLQVGNRKTMRAGSPGRASNHKFWSSENWITTLRLLRDVEPESFVLLTGAPNEAEMTEDLAAKVADKQIISVAHDMRITRLLALLRRSRGLVSVDTGTAHAAAGNACPVVVLFGPTDPRTVSPRGENVSVVCPSPRDGFDQIYERWEPIPMSTIQPDEVITAWQELVGGPAPG